MRAQRLLDQAPPEAQTGLAGELVLAADQFIITPAGRVEDAARAQAAGDEVRTVIAGYHWFTDWGRDTMISLEGLTLLTGRHREAGYILRTFAHYVRDGLIPNLFPEGEKEGLYHTADATLWFFHALDRYLEATGDRDDAAAAAAEVPRHRRPPPARHALRHRRRSGRRPAAPGAEGYQLTWMDAKVGDWVVTPRRGKAVEINALWYNALRLLEGWLREEGDEAAATAMAGHAEQARASFNRRFWNADERLSLRRGGRRAGRRSRPAGPTRSSPSRSTIRCSTANTGRPVLEVVQRAAADAGGPAFAGAGQPGLQAEVLRRPARARRRLSSGDGLGLADRPVHRRLAARCIPDDRAGAREFLSGFGDHLGEACIGSISEIFDAEAPFTPRGCIAQAWSVAEVLRCWVKTEA